MGNEEVPAVGGEVGVSPTEHGDKVVFVGLDRALCGVGSVVPRRHQLVGHIEFSQVLFEVRGDLIVQANGSRPETVSGEGQVAFREAPDQLFGLLRLDGGGMDVIGVIIIHDKEVFVSPG